jgi:hypothetical protein
MIHFCEKNLGKLLFPRSEPWRRQQKMRVVFLILLLELFIAVVVVGIAMLSDMTWK